MKLVNVEVAGSTTGETKTKKNNFRLRLRFFFFSGYAYVSGR